MIRTEDRDQVRPRTGDQIHVLIDRVRRAQVPVVPDVHLRGNRNDKVLLQERTEIPSVPEVLQESLGLELRQYIDRPDPRVHEVAEDEVDDAILSTERHGGLASELGQWKQTCSTAAGHDHREHSSCHGNLPSSEP